MISACAASITKKPSDAILPDTDYVPGVGRIISFIPTSVFPQKIYGGMGSIWYWFEECNCIVQLDPIEQREINTIGIGNGMVGPYGNPKDLILGDQVIWVTDTGNNSILGMDGKTQEIIKRFPLEIPGTGGNLERYQPFGFAVSETDIWVSDFDNNAILRVDLETGVIVTKIPEIRHPAGLVIGHDSVWVVEHRAGRVIRIDPITNTILATIPINVQATPAWSPACGMCLYHVVIGPDAVWIPLNRGRGIARIDPQTNAVTEIISLDMPVHQLAIGKDSIWAVGSSVGTECVADPSALTRIDLSTGEITGIFPIPCAFSVTVFEGDIFVGHGIPYEFTQVLRLHPD
jgi:streptogramin lyase